MSMVQEAAGVQGAKRQSWRHANPRDLLINIVAKHKGADRDYLFEEFYRAAVDNVDIIGSIIEYWFANNYHSLTKQIASDNAKTRSAARVGKMQEELKENIKQTAAIMLLDLMMPNGKTLRDCTGKECQSLSKKTGSWLAKIAQKIPATKKVGECLSEIQVKRLYANV